MVKLSRRDLLLSSLSAGAAVVVSGGVVEAIARSSSRLAPSQMKLGLVTYQWGNDWDVPTLIRHCEETNVLGVELRTTHKHGVEPSLNGRQRSYQQERSYKNCDVAHDSNLANSMDE